MQLGMIGLGRMGANMVRRLVRDGHTCVVYDTDADAVGALAGEGVRGVDSTRALVDALDAPRILWIMIPAAKVDDLLETLVEQMQPGDLIVDGGNSHYRDDIRRAAVLAARGLRYADVGTSGGVRGLERGYCLMVGGDGDDFRRLEPLLVSLAPGVDAAPRIDPGSGPPGPAEHGYLHCGPHGAGHFVKMVHNGIEYGMMAAYAEGLQLLASADDEAIAPGGYALDTGAITELWRRGSVVGSWLLDLTAEALASNPTLDGFGEAVEDSGEGRWSVQAAVDAGVPAHVLSAALYARFASRGNEAFANRVLSAMRFGFGGHRRNAGERGD